MKYTYDPVADAINFAFKKGKVERTEEIAPGVILDFNQKGELLYLEIIDASKRLRGKTGGKTSSKIFPYSRREVRSLLTIK